MEKNAKSIDTYFILWLSWENIYNYLKNMKKTFLNSILIDKKWSKRTELDITLVIILIILIRTVLFIRN